MKKLERIERHNLVTIIDTFLKNGYKVVIEQCHITSLYNVAVLTKGEEE